jgi:hypothetical protein
MAWRRRITMNSHCNRREPKVTTNPYMCIFKNHVGLILYVLYIFVLYILLPSKTGYRRKDKARDGSDKKMRKKT